MLAFCWHFVWVAVVGCGWEWAGCQADRTAGVRDSGKNGGAAAAALVPSVGARFSQTDTQPDGKRDGKRDGKKDGKRDGQTERDNGQ